MRRVRFWPGVLILAAGCYTFNPSAIPSHIKTLSIPTAENKTLEASLAEELTTDLTDRFVRDNTLKVVQSDADAVLEATITGYENRVFGFTSNQVADQYIVILTVDMTLRDRVKNKEIWSQTGMVGRQAYSVSGTGGGITSEEEARKAAMKQVVDAAISRTVEGW